jgi:hypothetical protein
MSWTTILPSRACTASVTTRQAFACSDVYTPGVRA